MTSVILVTPHVRSDIGHGGIHRTYQLAHDLESIVGRENFTLVTFSQASASKFGKVASYLNRIRRRLKAYWGNPIKLLGFSPYFPNIYYEPEFMARYEHQISHVERPAVCVIEHTGFSDLISINKRHGIPTVSCVQNLESFDMRASVWQSFRQREKYARGIDFVNELEVFSRCAERLFISKIETGLVQGLGLKSRYYPYLPVGKIRDNLESIRYQRSQTSPIPGLFLVLGSAHHRSSGAGFEWLLNQVREHGLPERTRLVFVGAGTDILSPRFMSPGLEFRGYVAQPELDSLMISAQGVLIPQVWGLGALTRLAELACAGIPMVVSHYPVLATDLPLQIESVDDDWNAWVETMERIMSDPLTNSASANEYATWDSQQPRTLSNVISQV
jgi:hypothetical protein